MLFRRLLISSLGNRSRFHGFLIIICLMSSPPVFTQSVRFLSTKDGLPQSFISGLVQDDSSFIWISTRNGLARFDGIQYRNFQHNHYDTSTIASNIMIWMKRDDKNQLWMEYESGEIDGMDPVTESIHHLLKGNLPDSSGVQFVRRGWLVDEDGLFWGIVRSAGLNTYDYQTKKIEHFSRSNAGFSSDTIWGLAEIKNQGIWILSHYGISQFNKKTKQFTHWILPFKQDFNNFPAANAVAIDLHVRKNGELMWGDRNKIYFFNPATHSFRSIALASPGYLGVRWIRTAGDGMDYFETYGSIYRYSNQTGLSLIAKTDNALNADVKSFLVDRSGLIWLGTNAGGIRQIDLQTPFFESYKYKKDFVTDMLEQELGVNVPQMFNWTLKDEIFSPPSYHFRTAYDKNKRLYLALNETVCYYDNLKKQYVRLPLIPIAAQSFIKGIGIKGISMLRQTIPMLVCYNGNVLTYDSLRKTWDQFIDPEYIRKTFGASILPQDILADDKNIWISTANDGLLKIDIQTKRIQQFRESKLPDSLPSNQLLGLIADPHRPDRLWMGSYQGLICLNKKTMKCELYDMKDGLPDITVYSILSDKPGNLWFATNKGLCCFDPETHHIRVFSTRHGLPGDEFNRFHQMMLPDGRMVFGSTDGWIKFDPLRIRNDNYEPPLAFTELRINYKRIMPSTDEHSILRVPLNALKELVLPYEQNTVSVSFAGLEFGQAQDLQYRYRLEGYDNDWINVGRTHQANYTKLPSGNYTLFVNASNSTGKWSSHVNALRIKINAPWWATKMAYFCYLIIASGLTWTFIRLRVDRIVIQREMTLKEKEALQLKELDDMKSRFFSNITHEFRTPLTLIMGPAEQLKETNAGNPNQFRMADTIVNNAKQLLILINRLMDLSKLEARALKLHEKRGNPADTIRSIFYSFERDAETKQILLLLNDETGHIDCWYYADALERIIYNLVSNALKFTDPGGTVEISIAQKEEALHIKVKDNGIGIPQNKLPYIFERFYQAGEHSGLSDQEWDQGTGIGLSLVKELVNQVEGSIEVESSTITAGQLSPGTVFTLILPYRLATEEIIIAAPETDEHEASGEINEEPDKTAQILVVEDNVELAQFIISILSAQYKVTHALNGSLGLHAALSAIPDLVISDVMMPVMDGYELCSLLKNDIRSSHIPIILLTAKTSQENLIEGLEKGADDYLTKPFHPTELSLRVHNLLERQKKLRDRLRQEMALPGAPVTKPAVQDIFITRLYEVLDEHLDDTYFGVDQIVDTMNISRSNIHRKLKALTGMSTSEVVRNYRLKRACLFLEEGFNSSDAAYKTGFGSPAYFTKSFREVYGITPLEFIKQQRSKA